ncbi:unnamed protein product [Cunninghamella blakesleeana]
MKFTTAMFATVICMVGLLQTVFAQTLTITGPVEGTTLTKGQSQKISWVGNLSTTDKNIKIQLLKGDSNNLQPVKVLAENVNVQDGAKVITVPGDVPEDDDYAISIGQGPSVAYMGKITIKNYIQRRHQHLQRRADKEGEMKVNGGMTKYSFNLAILGLVFFAMITLF